MLFLTVRQHRRAAAKHRDLEAIQNPIPKLSAREDQLCLELTRHRVEPSVQDTGVGSACPEAWLGLGLKHGSRQAVAHKRQRDRSAHHPSADHDNFGGFRGCR
jgi:hypothetical protein